MLKANKHVWVPMRNSESYCMNCTQFPDGKYTTHCPNRCVTFAERTAINNHELDFRYGKWIKKPKGNVQHCECCKQETTHIYMCTNCRMY